MVGAMTKIAILGGGQIGEALISGLVESGFNAPDITVTNRTASRGEELKSRYGVNVTTDNAAAVDGADYIFASVKPYAILDLLSEINPAKDAVVVSMAAGLTLEALQSAAGQGVPIVRVMPNTPMLVRRGMCTCAAGEHVTKAQMRSVTELLEAVGEVAVIPEKNIDAATALAGSSPAYFFLVAEALVDAGVQLGLPRDIAEKLAAQAAAGAGDMLAKSGRSATQLRAGVTSPGGTTAAAVRELEESGLRGAFYRAAEACSERAKELG
ncbi:pyrroline-5-carboxylate reductase [Corynebacterium macginleyi]|nr:pyrroline-5-carboxylate reductase [Corynebacterium macginleyi]